MYCVQHIAVSGATPLVEGSQGVGAENQPWQSLAREHYDKYGAWAPCEDVAPQAVEKFDKWNLLTPSSWRAAHAPSGVDQEPA